MAKIGSQEELGFNPFGRGTIANAAKPIVRKGVQPNAFETSVATVEREVEVPFPEPPAREAPPRIDKTVTEPRKATSLATALETTVRFKLYENEKREIETAVKRLAGQLHTEVNFSNICRCLWQLYLDNEDDILDRFRRTHESLKRPANNDLQAIAEFEERLSKIIHDGIISAARRREIR
jgi:hypothetical protein